jgi:hypothetical protein
MQATPSASALPAELNNHHINKQTKAGRHASMPPAFVLAKIKKVV